MHMIHDTCSWSSLLSEVLLCGYPPFFGETDADVLAKALNPKSLSRFCHSSSSELDRCDWETSTSILQTGRTCQNLRDSFGAASGLETSVQIYLSIYIYIYIIYIYICMISKNLYISYTGGASQESRVIFRTGLRVWIGLLPFVIPTMYIYIYICK